MYGRLAYAKLFGCLSHCCIRIDNEIGNFNGPLFNVGFQAGPPLYSSLGYIYERRGEVRTYT